MCVCVCMYAYVCERESERESVCVRCCFCCLFVLCLTFVAYDLSHKTCVVHFPMIDYADPDYQPASPHNTQLDTRHSPLSVSPLTLRKKTDDLCSAIATVRVLRAQKS
jgi:hypothetical protein